MSLRALLPVLIVLATAGFVVGTTIERSNEPSESPVAHAADGGSASAHSESGEGEATEPAGETGSESPAEHAAESSGSESRSEPRHAELKPFGVDVEAVSFVILAAVVSLLLALAAWLRPQPAPLLVAIAAAMVAFAILDIREVSHQSDEGKTGLAVVAGAIAALHIAAGLVAGLMARRAGGAEPSSPVVATGA